MTVEPTRRRLLAGALSVMPASAANASQDSSVRAVGDLRIDPRAGDIVYCSCREKLGDGGGGRFYWDPTSVDVDDGGCVIAMIGVAVGRWRRECTSPLNPVWYGADPSGVRDSTSAFKATLAREEDIFVPAGVFRISETLSLARSGRRIVGAGQGVTKILMAGRNLPIIRWRGARCSLESLQLEYELQQDEVDQESAGLMVDNTGPKNTRALQKSALRNVSIRNAYIGILVPSGCVFFSVTVDNVEVDGYAKSALYMANGSSGTGSAILNLYTQNSRRADCIGPAVQFSSIVDGFIGQMNIEHTKVRDHALHFISSDHVSVSSLHVEGCQLLSEGKSFVAASGTILVSIDVLSIQFAEIRKNCFLFSMYDAPRICVRSLTLRDLTGDAVMKPYNHVAVQRDAPVRLADLMVESVSLGRGSKDRISMPARIDQLSGQNSVLRQWGSEIYFRNVGGVREYFGVRPPLSGVFQAGDRVYNLQPALGQPTCWICLASGMPGIWEPGPKV